MVKRRLNPAITEDRESKLIQLRGDMEAMREIATGRDHAMWSRLKTILEANINTVNMRLDGFHKMNDEGVRYLLKEKQDFEFVISLVDDCDGHMQAINEDIKKLEQDVTERKTIQSGR